MAPAAPERVNGFHNNLDGDTYAASSWDLTTQFGSRKFAESSLPIVLPAVRKTYRRGLLHVPELGAGTSLFGQVICGALHEEGYSPKLIPSEMQLESVRAIPSSPDTLRSISNSAQLPLSLAKDTSVPRLVLSRAMGHYLPEDTHQEMIKDVARVLPARLLWIDEISSGDPVMLRGFERLLNRISGKEMRYLCESQYPQFMQNVTNERGEPLFEILRLGDASSQPRGAAELSRRYLNEHFIFSQRNDIEERGLSAEQMKADIHRIAKAEKVLTTKVRQGGISREKAIVLLDAITGQTPAFGYFREIVVEEVLSHLRKNNVSQSPDLKLVNIDGRPDVWINVRYPIFALTRTTNAAPQLDK